jgi:hypothetical protein
MPGNWPQNEFPNLTDTNCSVTSPVTRRYNCIAWAAKNNTRWWWPDPFGIGYWPLAERRVTFDCFVKAFESLGYRVCLSDALEEGFEKIAIYGIKSPDGSALPTHAALQLNNGEWTSKLGQFEDISHKSAEDLIGPVYGRPLVFMSRPKS